MITNIKGTVSQFRQTTQKRLEEVTHKTSAMPSANYKMVTYYKSKFNLNAVPVSLSSRNEVPLIKEGDEIAVAGFMLFGEMRAVNYKNLTADYFKDNSGLVLIFVSLAIIMLSFFVTPEIVVRFHKPLGDSFFAPFLMFVKWVMMRLMGTLLFLDSLKNYLVSRSLNSI